MYLDLVDTKIVEMGIFEFLSQIWMVTLNVRDFRGKFQSKSGFMAMATKDLWGKKSKFPISTTFGLSNAIQTQSLSYIVKVRSELFRA